MLLENQLIGFEAKFKNRFRKEGRSRYTTNPNMERVRLFCLAMTLVVAIKAISVPFTVVPSTHLRRGYDKSRCLEENIATSGPCNSPRRLKAYHLQSTVNNSLVSYCACCCFFVAARGKSHRLLCFNSPLMLSDFWRTTKVFQV